MNDLREWLVSKLNDSVEIGGDDELILGFIHKLDALPPSEITEPRGCPTPGSCSAVEELADLKQRLLPQANGRAERAEKARQMAVAERDEMLEKLRAATSMPCAPPATAAPSVWTCVLEEGATAWQDAALAHLAVVSVLMSPQDVLRVQNFINDSRMKSGPVEETAIGHARYEYLRTLNPREFAALYDEALADERFDDLVDRHRMKGENP